MQLPAPIITSHQFSHLDTTLTAVLSQNINDWLSVRKFDLKPKFESWNLLFSCKMALVDCQYEAGKGSHLPEPGSNSGLVVPRACNSWQNQSSPTITWWTQNCNNHWVGFAKLNTTNCGLSFSGKQVSSQSLGVTTKRLTVSRPSKVSHWEDC